MKVPDVLVSGNHAAIRAWRKQQSLLNTLRKRPDLLMEASLTEAEREWIDRYSQEMSKDQPDPVI
jgi:tRNA (guanine37-N1)-methyltransferase